MRIVSLKDATRAAATMTMCGVCVLALTASTVAHADHRRRGDRSGPPPLIFGVYAGSVAGLPEGGVATGPPDDAAKIESALDSLQPGRHPFLVRAFTGFVDQPPGSIAGTTPTDIAQYVDRGRKIDLVLAYSSSVNNQEPWIRWVKDMVHAYGSVLGAVQITEEANILNPPGEDAVERVRKAVVSGVLAADEQLREDRRRDSVAIGMSVFAAGDPDVQFWEDIKRFATPRFRHVLDYVGVDLYPDFIYGRQDISEEVEKTLRVVREQSMPIAGLDQGVAIRVTENGWPTGLDSDGTPRTETQQAAALTEAVHTISELRGELNITHYEFFDLRDADSSVANPWYQFGLLRSDYTVKPAFKTYRELIRRYGSMRR